MSALTWLRKVFCPILFAAIASGLAGLVPRMLMEASLLRVVLTTAACEIVVLPLVWFVLLDAEEREYIAAKWAKAKKKMTGGGAK